MATDNTPPRLRLIGTIAFIVVITLLGLNFVFESYFAYMSDEAKREKLAPTSELLAQVAAERAALAAAKPLDQAVAQLKAGRSELIEPKPSDDLGAMTGWSKLPKHLPLPAPGAGAMHAPETHAPDMTAAAGDAGAAMADGGTPAPAAAADGGAPKATGGAPAAPAKDAGAHAPH
jgi:hypothetical protein